ncbi:hypothetical protein ACI7RC_19925 [Brevibacillus sp. B_LB10_24]|uniref:hypothetical protein n=1 Tax=Brevibacillus sp. B_LB10_24 TaxID=3380645 RepID=UPI0038B709A3
MGTPRAIPSLCSIMLISGCYTHNAAQPPAGTKSITGAPHVRTAPAAPGAPGTPAAPGGPALPGNHYGKPVNRQDAGVIPSEFGVKTETTNRHGHNFSGMGTGVYGRIGSSGLHEGGVSSHIQSRLHSEGIDGIKVLVLDDTVILAQDQKQISAHRYDPMQHKLLNPTAGESGKGARSSTDPGLGTKGTSKAVDHDNLSAAREHIHSLFGSDVRVMTVTDRSAIQAIDRIKAKLKSGSASHAEISRDLSTIMRSAKK